MACLTYDKKGKRWHFGLERGKGADFSTRTESPQVFLLSVWVGERAPRMGSSNYQVKHPHQPLP